MVELQGKWDYIAKHRQLEERGESRTHCSDLVFCGSSFWLIYRINFPFCKFMGVECKFFLCLLVATVYDSGPFPCHFLFTLLLGKLCCRQGACYVFYWYSFRRSAR